VKRRKLPFKQADVSRALKAVAAAGLKAGRVEVDPGGRFSVVIDDGSKLETASPLDIWQAKRHARPTSA